MKQAPRPDIPEVTGVQDLLERLRLSSEQKRTQQQQQTAGTDPTSVLFGSPHTPQENGYFSRRNSHGSMDSFWDEVRSAVGDQDEDAPEPSAAPLAQPALPGPESDFGPSGSDSSGENTAARDADIQSALEVLGQGLPLSQDAAAVSAAEPHVQAQPQHSTRPPDPQDTQAVEISPAAPAPATTSHHLPAEIASPVNSDELLLMSEMENLQAESGFTQLGDDVRYPSPGGTFSSSEHQSGISSGSGQLTPSATIPARLTASHLSTFTTTAADSMLTDVESCFEDSDTDDEGLLKHTTVRSAKESLEHLELIGRGAFGSVYRGTWKGKLVAVKVVEGDDDLMMLPGPHDSDEYLETASRRSCSSSALLEAAVSSAVNHPNVVQTYDYRVFDPDAQVLSSSASFRSPLRETRIIMEFCDAGCLEEAVRDGRLNARTSIGLHHICKTLMEVVDAMLYLHRLQVTHRDLKPKNVLLQSCRDDSRGFVAKVSDFGLSKLLPENNNNKGSMFPAEQAPAGTVTHMSPEALAEGALSTAADVYAFGIMMWEVWTGRAPFQRLSKMQVMLAVVNEALRPEFPAGCPAWYVSLAAACWQQDPKQRITFEEVRRILRARYWEGPSLIYHQ